MTHERISNAEYFEAFDYGYGFGLGMMYGLRMSVRTLALDGKKDDRWITTENGNKALIDGKTGEVKAGFGGKFNGRKIDEISNESLKQEKYEKSLGSAFDHIKEKYKDKSNRQLAREHEKRSNEELYGEEVTGVKGHDAIWALVERRNGHVKGAFWRKGVGDIDLIWGDSDIGLEHIIRRRNIKQQNCFEVLNNLPDVIKHGRLSENNRDGKESFVFTLNDYEVIVTKALNKKEGDQAVVTSYEIERKKPEPQ